MDIPHALAGRILRGVDYDLCDAQIFVGSTSITNIKKALSDRQSRVKNASFVPPLMPQAVSLATVYRGQQRWDFLFSSPKDGATICAFYLNQLRLLGWRSFRMIEDERIESGGFARPNWLRGHAGYLYNRREALTLRFHICEENAARTTFLLSVDEATYNRKLRQAEIEIDIDFRPPMPILMLSEGCRRQAGKGERKKVWETLKTR